MVERLLDVAGTSTTNRVKNLTFQGLTFQNTDYSLYTVAGSHGKATVQGATVYVAYGDGNWHNSKYEITDTLPGMINVSNAESIDFTGNVLKHSGNEGISMVNDVVSSSIVGNFVTDIAGSGITVGHPQHVYLGDGGAHARYPAGVEGICTSNTISNNVLSNISSQPGFGGHAGITAFFVTGLTITHNHIQTTAYNGINLGWGWRNFTDSTTCKNNTVSYNRLINTLNRLHDSGAVYTIGQMPGTNINQNYVKGIPSNSSGPTYGLHNDEGSAYITENDNVLDIDPGVTYTINCEDFGAKHDLTIRRTYATVNKMGANPPNSVIDPPVAVADNVWPPDAIQHLCRLRHSGRVPERPAQQPVVAAGSCVPRQRLGCGRYQQLDHSKHRRRSEHGLGRSRGDDPFAEGATMTKAAGNATSIAVPTSAGTYKLSVLDAQGTKAGESAAQLKVK